MQIDELLKKTFGFDQTYDEFELLETEQGAPPVFADKKSEPKTKTAQAAPGIPTIEAQANVEEGATLVENLDKNIAKLKEVFLAEQNKDVIFRNLKLGGKIRACVICMSGMSDTQVINDYILRQMMAPDVLKDFHEDLSVGKRDLMQYMEQNVISIAEMSMKEVIGEIAFAIMSGMTAILVQGENKAMIVETRGFEHRSISEAKSEKAVKGPHEGFIESIRTNITMVRRIIKTTDLVCEFKPLGGDNNAQIALVYRKGVVNQSLLDEVNKRLSKIKTRFILGEGMTEQFMETRKYSMIPQVVNTERPDKVAAMLMSGHIALLFEGAPYATVLPATFFTLMSTPDDTYLRRTFGNLNKFIRYAGLLISIFLPGLYVAVLSYHPGLISTELINTILTSRRLISFPVQLELIFLMGIFQLVRECGIRVPGSMGQSLSVIAGLVLGQASVVANVVSSIILILVAVTGLGNYCIPNLSLQIAAVWLSIVMILAASVAGLFGMSIAFIILMVYLCSVKSFGVPLFAPFAPKTHSNKRPFGRGMLDMSHRGQDYTNEQNEA